MTDFIPELPKFLPETHEAWALNQAIAEISRSGVFILGSGSLQFVNSRFAQIFGFESPNEIIGKVPLMELIAPKDREIVVDNLLRKIQGPQLDQVNRFRTDGSSVRLEIAHAGLFGSISDVNEQSRKRIFATLASAIPCVEDLMGSYHNFVRSLTGELCDWCAIDLHEEEGFIRRVAHAHIDPERVMWLERLKREYPIGVIPHQWMRKSLKKGEVMIFNDITQEKILSDFYDQNTPHRPAVFNSTCVDENSRQ